MDVLEEELLEINRDQMFPEEEEEKFAMRSKSVSLAGSTTELHTLSRARSGEDLRSDEEEVGGPHLTDCVPLPSIYSGGGDFCDTSDGKCKSIWKV